MVLSANVTNLITEVARLCRDEGITSVEEQDYIDALNKAQDLISELTALFHEKTTYDTTEGTQNYDLPDTYMATYAEDSLVYTDENSVDHTVYYTTYDNVRKYDDLTTASGTPQFFWVEDNDIYLYPTPDYSGSDNLELEYFSYASNLSGGTTALSSITWIYDTYTILSSDTLVFCSGTFTVTLPSAVTYTDMEVTIKNVGTGVVTLTTSDSQVIDGDTNYHLYTQFGSVKVRSDGSNWSIIGKV